MLERQSSRLNEDTEQVQSSFRWLRQQEAKRKAGQTGPVVEAVRDLSHFSSDADSELSLQKVGWQMGVRIGYEDGG